MTAAPADKGKGAGKGSSPKLGVCFFHNTEAGCTKSAKECKFEHKKLSPAEAAKLVKPASRDSRATSPGGKRPGTGQTWSEGQCKGRAKIAELLL